MDQDNKAELERLKGAYRAALEAHGACPWGAPERAALEQEVDRTQALLLAATLRASGWGPMPEPPVPPPRPSGEAKTDSQTVAEWANEDHREAASLATRGVNAWLAGNPDAADEGLASLDALERTEEAKLAEAGPLRDEWAKLIGKPIAEVVRWKQERYAPTMNRLFGDRVKVCIECGGWFAPHDKRDRHCSKACRDRVASRGRERIGTGKSPEEAARRRTEARLRRHLGDCRACKVGEWCPDREAMLGADALAHRADLSPESAEEMQACAAIGRVKIR